MSRVFISYARDDRQMASIVAEALQAAGHSVFLDQFLVGGTDFKSEIYNSLMQSTAVIVLLSGNARKSEWVQDEIATAIAQGTKIVPILLDGEAKNNLVWPLVATRQAISAVGGFDDRSIRQVVASVETKDPHP